MKIEGQGPVNPLERIFKKDKASSSKSLAKSEGKVEDKIQISNKAYQMQQLALVREILKEVSEVRQDKVSQIREAIEKGEYEVDAREVAEKIIEFYG